ARLARYPARLPPLAIPRHREDAGCRGLPHPAWTREQVSMGHATARHGAAQRRRDVILGDQVGELLGAVFAGKGDHRVNLTKVRSAECGVRSITGSVVRHELALPLRIPHSPLRIAVE